MDRTNPVFFHRSLTNENIIPNWSEKKQNKLAEDVLKNDMLNLVSSYQQQLGAKETGLDDAIEFLQNTVILLEVLRNRRTIIVLHDLNLTKLYSVETMVS